jgi:hypothetical protein
MLAFLTPSTIKNLGIGGFLLGLAICGFAYVVFRYLLLKPSIKLVARFLLRGNTREHSCPTCGYDIRATPERCPECGSILQAWKPRK